MDGWTQLASARTASGDELLLRERAGCVELRCNGWELMSNRAHHSEAALATLACARIPRETPAVLIGGLGLGYTLRAALDHLPRSARVVVAELLPEVVGWNRGVLAHLAGRPLDDERVTVIPSGVLPLLRAEPPASFDAILLDTDNGPDSVMLSGNGVLYEPECLRLIRRVLRPGGVLAVWSADPSPRFERHLRIAGFRWEVQNVPARGARNDPLHTIYLARSAD